MTLKDKAVNKFFSGYSQYLRDLVFKLIISTVISVCTSIVYFKLIGVDKKTNCDIFFSN